ncbi:MAG: hypothetical protein Tsb0015_11800 [Simkaniaceae bacterium]
MKDAINNFLNLVRKKEQKIGLWWLHEEGHCLDIHLTKALFLSSKLSIPLHLSIDPSKIMQDASQCIATYSHVRVLQKGRLSAGISALGNDKAAMEKLFPQAFVPFLYDPSANPIPKSADLRRLFPLNKEEWLWNIDLDMRWESRLLQNCLGHMREKMQTRNLFGICTGPSLTSRQWEYFESFLLQTKEIFPIIWADMKHWCACRIQKIRE